MTEQTTQPPPFERDAQLNIFGRMAAIMGDLGYVQRTGRAPEAAGGYSYVKHDMVTAAVRPLLIKHGVGIICSLGSHQCEKLVSKNRDGQDRTVLFTQVTMKTTFVNVDKPEDRYEVEMPGYGLDTQDKSVGKAISYAFKYTILKNLAMETGDEDIEAKAIDLATNTSKTPAQRKTPKKTAKPSDELKALVAAWSQCPPEDVPASFKRVLEVCGLPTEKGLITVDHVIKAVDWCKAKMTEGKTFEDATAIQVNTQK